MRRNRWTGEKVDPTRLCVIEGKGKIRGVEKDSYADGLSQWGDGRRILSLEGHIFYFSTQFSIYSIVSRSNFQPVCQDALMCHKNF